MPDIVFGNLPAPEEDKFEIEGAETPTAAPEITFGAPAVQDESYLGAGLRNIAAMTKGVAKRALGFPGDIQRAVEGIGGAVRGAVGLPSTQESIEKYFEQVPGITPEQKEEVRGKWGQLEPTKFPTSREIGKGIDTASQKLFGVDPSYFKPKGDIEKILHSTTKDATSVALSSLLGAPGGLIIGGLEALVPNLLKFGAKKGKFSKGVQRMTKLGAQLLFGAYRLFKPRAAAKTSYGAASEALGETERIPLPRTQAELKKIEEKLIGGVLKPKWKKVVEEQAAALGHVKKSGSDVGRHILEDKSNLSHIIGEATTPKAAKSVLGGLQKALKSDLYSSDNKKFVTALRFGDQMWRDLKNSEKVFDSVKSILKHPATTVGSIGAITSIVLGGLKKPEDIPANLLTALGAGLGVAGGVKVVDMLAKSPSMYKYYGKILSAAAANKAQQVGILVDKLDKGLTEEFGEANKRESLS